MNAMSSHWLYSGYNADHWVSFTLEFNFDASFTVAQASFYAVVGGGSHHAGVVGYKSRPDPDGPDVPVNFGDWWAWKPYIYVDQVTSVTFGVAVGAGQEASVLCNLFFW